MQLILNGMRVVVKIRVPFWVLLCYGTFYLGYPKRDPNFDNHPREPHGDGVFRVACTEFGSFRRSGNRE